MHLLHPIFLIIFAILLLLFASEGDGRPDNSKPVLYAVAVLMIIAAGGRDWVGADYPVYRGMYYFGFPQYATYQDILDKALFRPSSMEIEWLFVLINKVFFDLGLPFFVVTLAFALIAVSLQLSTFLKYSALPVLSMLFYFMATYFFTDCGQMRQGLGTAICVFSMRYIIKRDLWRFLICIFIGLGMHKSTVIFLPAYWIATLPLNARKWIPIIIFCIILAPFQVYNFFGGVLQFLTPQDVSNAFEGYSNDTYYGTELKTGLGDAINIIMLLFMILYDKKAEETIHYHEYFRNLGMFGFCLYYIFRGNAIFATRLPGPYLVMTGYFVVPGIVMAVNIGMKRLMKMAFFSYFLLFNYAFSKVNALKGKFTWDTYRNVIWSK